MSNGPIMPGQLRYGQEQILVPYTEQYVDIPTAQSYVGNALAEVTPYDYNSCKLRLYATPDLSGFWFQAVSYGSINLPPTLTALSVQYESGGGDSTYIETASGTAVSPYSLGLSVAGTTQGSSYDIPKLIRTIRNNSYDKVKFTECWFYEPSGDIAAILARLTTQLGATVLEWPLFKVQSLVFVLRGERVSANARRSYQGSAAVGSTTGASSTSSNGLAFGKDFAPSIEEVEIPDTLHGAFTLTSPDSVSHTGIVAVSVSAGPISGGGAGTATATATASVSPTSVSATSPTGIPSSGLYLYVLESAPAVDFNNHLIRAVIFDFAQIA